MSKDVTKETEHIILEKTEHIIVYKIVEYYKQVKRKDIIDLTKKIYKDLFEREVSDDAVINWIREITGFREERNERTGNQELKPVENKRKKLKVLKVRSRGIYEVLNRIKVEPANKSIWDEVDRYLKLRREDRIISEELRVKHTEKIKEKIIRPWIQLLEDENTRTLTKLWKGEDSPLYKFFEQDFSDIEKDPLYRDLDNHLPSNLDNPKRIWENIRGEEKKLVNLEKTLLEGLKNELTDIAKERNLKEGWYIENLANAILVLTEYGLTDFMNTNDILEWLNLETSNGEIEVYFGNIKAYVIFRGKNVDNRTISQAILDILNDERIRKIVMNCKRLRELRIKIGKMKEELLNILRELEAYEILPSICKYITGGD